MNNMEIWQAIILGIVQGITEFVPISSSGHLLILEDSFGLNISNLAFDVAVHIATLIAIIWVLRSDIRGLFRHLERPQGVERSLILKIIIATIPAAVIGFLLSDSIIELIRSVQVVTISLILWGVILWIADYLSKSRKLIERIEKISWLKAIMIGLSQVLALIPGTSRSGITITAGLFSGINRATAARFSFLLSIPIIAGAGLLTGVDAYQSGIEVQYISLIAGFISALIVGIISIKFLLKFLEKKGFACFAIYRILLGVLLIVLFW